MRQYRQFRPMCNLDQESADISSRLNTQLMRNLRNQRPKVVHYQEPTMPKEAQIQSYRDRRAIQSQLELKRAMNSGEMQSQLILQEQMILQLKDQIQQLEGQLKQQNKEQQQQHQATLAKVSSPGRPRSAGLLKSIRAENLQQNMLNYKLNQLHVESTQLVQQNKINQLERQLENYRLQIQSYKDSIAEKSFTMLIDLKDQEISQLQKNFTDIAAKQRIYETNLLNQEDQIFELRQLNDIYKKQLKALLGKKALGDDSTLEQSGSMGSSGPQLTASDQKQYSKQVLQELSQYIKIVDGQKYKIEQQQKQILEKEEISLKLVNEMNKLKEDIKLKEESLFILNKGLKTEGAQEAENYKKEIFELKAAMSQKDDAISTYKIEALDLNSKIKAHETTIAELQHKLNSYEKTIETQNNQLNANVNAEQLATETQQKLESCQISFQEKVQALEEAEKKIQNKNEIIEELNEKIQEATTQIDEFQTVLSQLRQEIANKDTVIENLQQDSANLSAKYKDAEDLLETRQNELTQLNSTLQQKQTDYNTLYEQLQNVMKENEQKQSEEQKEPDIIEENIQTEEKQEEIVNEMQPYDESIQQEQQNEEQNVDYQEVQANNYELIVVTLNGQQQQQQQQDEQQQQQEEKELSIHDQDQNEAIQNVDFEQPSIGEEEKPLDTADHQNNEEHITESQQLDYDLINQTLLATKHAIEAEYEDKIADYANNLADTANDLVSHEHHCVSTIIGSVNFEECSEHHETVDDEKIEQQPKDNIEEKSEREPQEVEKEETHTSAYEAIVIGLQQPVQDENIKQHDEHNEIVVNENDYEIREVEKSQEVDENIKEEVNKEDFDEQQDNQDIKSNKNDASDPEQEQINEEKGDDFDEQQQKENTEPEAETQQNNYEMIVSTINNQGIESYHENNHNSNADETEQKLSDEGNLQIEANVKDDIQSIKEEDVSKDNENDQQIEENSLKDPEQEQSKMQTYELLNQELCNEHQEQTKENTELDKDNIEFQLDNQKEHDESEKSDQKLQNDQTEKNNIDNVELTSQNNDTIDKEPSVHQQDEEQAPALHQSIVKTVENEHQEESKEQQLNNYEFIVESVKNERHESVSEQKSEHEENPELPMIEEQQHDNDQEENNDPSIHEVEQENEGKQKDALDLYQIVAGEKNENQDTNEEKKDLTDMPMTLEENFNDEVNF